ncbi:hypothetical protein ACIPEN_18205 [Herbaspirillum chlorophenolicum]|uniref:Uncharacterized protein n=1 Tax=Herbaspirillum chlorophenolicum TaxID=211589 RepID=A0ABW8F386_9BURK
MNLKFINTRRQGLETAAAQVKSSAAHADRPADIKARRKDAMT